MKEFEIWIGDYHLGQGYENSTEPQLLTKVVSVDFKTACFKYELMGKLERILAGERKGDLNEQDYQWFYNPTRNSNGWLGRYFETKEAAQQSFVDAENQRQENLRQWKNRAE